MTATQKSAKFLLLALLLLAFLIMAMLAFFKLGKMPQDSEAQKYSPLPTQMLCQQKDQQCRQRLFMLSAKHYKRWKGFNFTNYKYTYRALGHLCEFTTQVTVVNGRPTQAYLIYTSENFGGDANCGGTGPTHYKIPVRDVKSIQDFFIEGLAKNDDVIGVAFDAKTHLPKLETFCLPPPGQYNSCQAHRTLVDSLEVLPDSGTTP